MAAIEINGKRHVLRGEDEYQLPIDRMARAVSTIRTAPEQEAPKPKPAPRTITTRDLWDELYQRGDIRPREVFIA